MLKYLKLIFCFGMILFFSGCLSKTDSSDSDNNNPIDYHSDGSYITYFSNQSDASKAINVIVMGDGYIKNDLTKNGVYETEAKKLINGLFNKAPFSQYKENFNAYIVFCESKQRGADSSPTSEDVDTVFDSHFGEAGIDRLLIIQNNAKVDEYLTKTGLTAKNPLNKSIILISVNSEKYGGSGGYYSVVSKNTYSLDVAIHEIGHSFGVLADEYEYGATFPKADAANEKNVDLTNDLSLIKWKQFLGLKGYEDVSAYEGAYYYPTGVWRPCNDCLMRNLGQNFCQICREAIVKEIYLCSGGIYNFNEFILKDKENLSSKINNYKNNNSYPEMIPDDLRHINH